MQNLADAAFLQKFFFLRRDVHDDGGSVFGAHAVADFITFFSRRNPVNRLRARLIGQRFNLYTVGYHEGRVKSQTEMSDDSRAFFGFFLIFFQKFFRSGKGNLGDITLHLVLGHADSVIGYD